MTKIVHGLDRRIVLDLINGCGPGMLYSAFFWDSTGETAYWAEAVDLTILTTGHIEKLQKILDDNPLD